jgi:hypothetical protein
MKVKLRENFLPLRSMLYVCEKLLQKEMKDEWGEDDFDEGEVLVSFDTEWVIRRFLMTLFVTIVMDCSWNRLQWGWEVLYSFGLRSTEMYKN